MNTPTHLPGIALCVGISLAATGPETVEQALLGRAWLEALVLAVLLGTAIRTAWTPGSTFRPGITVSANCCWKSPGPAGASISFATVMAVGLKLLTGIVGVVAFAILFSFGVGRALGSTHPPSLARRLWQFGDRCGGPGDRRGQR